MNPKLQARFETFKSSGLLPSPKGPALAARLLKLANACKAPGAPPVFALKDAIGILASPDELLRRLQKLVKAALAENKIPADRHHVVDGRECLAALKADEVLRDIPVVILTTPDVARDVVAAYRLGAAGYLTKSVAMVQFMAAIRRLGNYWIDLVRLPHHPSESGERSHD